MLGRSRTQRLFPVQIVLRTKFEHGCGSDAGFISQVGAAVTGKSPLASTLLSPHKQCITHVTHGEGLEFNAFH